MEFSQTLHEGYIKLKQSFTCFKCKSLLDGDSPFLSTCEHLQCKTCRNSNDNKCYLCKSPCNSSDIKNDHFVSTVLKSIRNIERIFDDASSVVSDYDIVVPKLAMKRNHKGESPLHLACKKGDLNKVKDLIREGVDVNMTDFANWAPIHEAIQRNHSECVEYLLTNGALVNIPGENYVTPLHKAVSLNKTDIAQILIRYGANLDTVDYSGLKPLERDKNHSLKIQRDYEITPRIFVSIETVVYCKDVSKIDKFKLTKAKVKFATRTEFLTKTDVTHYISTDDSEKLQFDILICLLQGIFIVNNDWIGKYSNNLDKKSFESIVKTYKKPNKLSIVNRLSKNPKLFDGMSFYVANHTQPKRTSGLKLTRDDLVVLIQTGGGKILHRPPIVKTGQNNIFCYPFHAVNTSLAVCDSYVIYHKSEKPELTYNMRELTYPRSAVTIVRSFVRIGGRFHKPLYRLEISDGTI